MAKLTSEVELNFESVVVDVENKVIRNVVLCGNESKNGYSYPPTCFKNEEHVVNLYNNRPVCIDHSSTPTARKIRDVAGFIRNVRFESGKPVGDIEIESAIDCGVDLIALASKKRKGIGMSHVAQCKMSRDKKTVELVEQVITVDVVVNPATTVSFFEQDQQKQEQMDIEQLKAEIDTLKAERAVLASDLGKANTASEGYKQETTNLLTEVTKLRDEVAKLKPVVEQYQKAEQATADKIAVEKLLAEAGLDIKDTVVVSEQFMTVLLTASETCRTALVADRKQATEGRSSGTQTGVQSPARQVKTESQVSPVDYLKKYISQNK